MSKEKKLQSRSAHVRAGSVNEEERSAEFVISSEAVDSYGTVFKADGWDLARYQKNPIVTYNHRDNSENPDTVIGTSEVRQEDGLVIAKLFFENGEDNPVAEKIFRKVKNGILRGASHWFQPHEGRFGNKDLGEDPDVLYFTRQELMAWSVVTIPSNPEALARNAEMVRSFRTRLTDVQGEEVTPKTDKKTELDEFEARFMYNKNKVEL